MSIIIIRKEVKMANIRIKAYAKEHKVYLWEVAMKMNISEPTMNRMLRTELPEDKSSKIMHYIDEIAREKESEV